MIAPGFFYKKSGLVRAARSYWQICLEILTVLSVAVDLSAPAALRILLRRILLAVALRILLRRILLIIALGILLAVVLRVASTAVLLRISLAIALLIFTHI